MPFPFLFQFRASVSNSIAFSNQIAIELDWVRLSVRLPNGSISYVGIRTPSCVRLVTKH